MKFNSKLNFDIYALLFTSYLSISLIRFLNPAHISQSLVLTLLGCFAFFKLFSQKKIQTEAIFFFALISTYLLSCFLVKRYDRIIQNLAFITINSGTAYLVRTKKISSEQISVIFLCLSTFLFFKILNQEDPVTTFKVMSGNGVSIMLAVIVISYYIARKFEGRHLPILPALINFILCIWAGGRAGIIASFVCLIGILWISCRNLRFHILSGLIFITIFEFLFHSKIADFLSNLYFFKFSVQRFSSHSIINDPRVNMVFDYFKTIDFFSLFFGSDLKNIWPSGNFWNYDPHNSFINLIYKNGIIGWINIAFTFFALTVFLKKNHLFFILFLSYILLALTDSFLFYESWDFLFIFFIVNAMQLSNFRKFKIFFLKFTS